MQNPDIGQVKLSSKVTVAKYIELKNKQNQKAIADFICDRFYERYIAPILALDKDEKHGFSIMANCCLMIEALESFYKGWPDTIRKSKQAFKDFFRRAEEFRDFTDYSEKFYYCVRCGILHQAETTSGWRITRKGSSPLFDPSSLTINATKFLYRLESHIKGYRLKLSESEWDSEVWKNLRTKMKTIIKNCMREER